MPLGKWQPFSRCLLSHGKKGYKTAQCCILQPHRAFSSADSVQTADDDLRRVEFSQDRIGSDGSLITGTLPGKQEHAAQQEGRARPAALSPTAPVLPPISEHELQQLVDTIADSRRLVVLTGAGCSTESSVPDYRGPQGAYSTGFKPITHQQFMASAEAQKRYWARSFAGWHEFSDIHPNAAHEGLARLQQRGWVDALITQNVDRLHSKAGATDVIELHGTTHRVICMGCGETSPRQPFQDLLAELNPGAADYVQRLIRAGHDAEAARQRSLRVGSTSVEEARQAQLFKRRPDGDVEIPVRRPDGDVELQDAGKGFIVPPCPSCGGILKPDVVFFGDGVPAERSKRVLALAHECDAMLVVGSSLMVYSAFRLAKAAKTGDGRLAILSAGPTRADAMADLKVEALAGEALSRIASHPALLIPKTAV